MVKPGTTPKRTAPTSSFCNGFRNIVWFFPCQWETNNLLSDRLLKASFRYLGWVCHSNAGKLTNLLQCFWMPHQMLVSEVAWALEGSISIEFNDSSNNLKPIVVFPYLWLGQKCHTLRARFVWMPRNRAMNFIKCLSCLQRKSHGGWGPSPAAACRTNSQRHNGLFTDFEVLSFITVCQYEEHSLLGEWEGYI